MKPIVNIILHFCFGFTVLVSCSERKNEPISEISSTEENIDQPSVDEIIPDPPAESSIGKLEQNLIDAGLVNVQEVDSTILVDLKYSSEDNFSGVDLYGSLENCYLQKEAAEMLAKAQKFLKEKYPNYTLLVYDGARPLHIQKLLWDTLDMPINKKKSYVADPEIGSIHNFGSAVDVTIAMDDKTPLDMGTDYDYFGILAHPSKETEMLGKGLLNEDQIKNRKLLREVMTKAGFTPIKYEWWHFNAVSRARAKEVYGIIE